MTVAVVTRRRARPGEEAAMIAAVVRSAETGSPAGQPAARLFQDFEDPERFLRIVEAADRGAAEAAAVGEMLPAAYCAGETERQVYERISEGEGVARLSATAGGAIVELPESASGAARAFSDQVAREMCARPDVARVAIYRGLDNPHRFLALCDWETEAALQAFYAEVLPTYASAVRDHGGRLDVFVERTQADLDRYPREPNAPRPAEQPGLTPTD
jgi:hypothetical protein